MYELKEREWDRQKEYKADNEKGEGKKTGIWKNKTGRVKGKEEGVRRERERGETEK